MSALRGAKTRAVTAALVVALGGCANLTAPSHQEAYDKAMQGIAVPAEWSAAAEANAFRPEWIGFAEDTELKALIDEAIAHNPDLRVAGTRLEQVRLQMGLAGADPLADGHVRREIFRFAAAGERARHQRLRRRVELGG